MSSRREDGPPAGGDSPDRRPPAGSSRRGPRGAHGLGNGPDMDGGPMDRGDRRGGRVGGGRGGGGGPRGGGGRAGPSGADDRARDEQGKRHQGFVRNLKDSYGFLQAADSEIQYFFHFSELRDCDVRDLRNGSEVEYSLCHPSRPNEKTMAVRVCPLPQGTIKLEEEVMSGQEGVVVREMRETRGYDRSRQKGESYGGRVKLIVKEAEAAGAGKEGGEGGGEEGAAKAQGPEKSSSERSPAGKTQTFPFGGDDVVPKEDGKGYTPCEGDIVRFDVVMVRTTRQQRASNIVFVSAPEPPKIPRETGMLATVKDSFGFIRCADRDERLFFHISEFADKEHMPRAGDEIEFSVAPDRDGRNTAVQIKVLAKGSVTFVETLPDKKQGVVERALKVPVQKKGGFGREERGREPFGGILSYEEEEGKKEKLPFDGGQLADQAMLPLMGDTVEFKVQVDKPTKKRKAVQVRVVKYTTEGREQGVLQKCKAGLPYAHIKCTEREDPVFLFQSEYQPGQLQDAEEGEGAEEKGKGEAEAGGEGAKEGEEAGKATPEKKEGEKREGEKKGKDGGTELGALTNGDELEFNVVGSRQEGKLTAIRVVKLPAGTVSFEKTLEGRFEGIVEKPLPNGVHTLSKKALKDHPPKGFIRPLAPPSSEEEEGRKLSSEEETDEGEAERAAALQSERGRRERGRGGKLKDPEVGLVSFGLSDTDNLAVALHKGDRVEYTAIMDKPSKKQRAAKVHLLAAAAEPGQAAEATRDGPEEGVIAQIKHHHGYIRCAARDLRLPFFFPDVDAESLAQALERESAAKAEKDKAEKDKAKAEGDAAAAEPRAGSPPPRAAGSPEPEVAAASPEPGALSGEEAEHDAAQRGAQEGNAKGRRPRAGDEVSFFILSDPTTRVLKAVDAKILPKGTVSLETVSEERVKGVVGERETRAKDGLHAGGGSVRHAQGESTVNLHFGTADLREARHLVFKGDTVEYSVATDRATGEMSARDVVSFPTEGIVESVKEGGNGMVRADEGVSQDKDKDKAVPFAATEVDKGDKGKLEKGSDVSFFYAINPKNKEICAEKVKRIYRERPNKEKMPERMKRQQEVPKAHSRLAGGPDGTKGFNWAAMGLGRAKPPPKTNFNVNVQEFVPSSPVVPTGEAAATPAFPT